MRIFTNIIDFRIESELGSALLDSVFPPRCAACRSWCTEGFCEACQAALQPIESPFCERCGLPFDPLSKADICRDCRPNRHHGEPSFDSLRSLYAFTGPLRPAVHRFKYSGRVALARPLAAMMHRYLQEQPLQRAASQRIPMESLSYIVPVPLHPLRRWRRGYNQSDLLAKELNRLLPADSPATYAPLLQRTRYTASQVELDRRHRSANVKAAFQLEERYRSLLASKGRIVLLIDDVATTGATINECARVLKASGIAEVYALTLARQP